MSGLAELAIWGKILNVYQEIKHTDVLQLNNKKHLISELVEVYKKIKEDDIPAFPNLCRGLSIDSLTWVSGQYSFQRKNGQSCHLIRNEEVFSSTVCRYTGIEDKKSRKIFEYDILFSSGDMINIATMKPTGSYEEYVEVLWHKTGWAIRPLFNSKWTRKWNNFKIPNPVVSCDHRTVVGNIFDNPEILSIWKDKKDAWGLEDEAS